MKRLLLVAVPTTLLLLSATARAESVRGDFNGDGYVDLAVGVPGDLVRSRGPARVVRAGAVNVIYGSAAGLTAGGNQIWTQNSPGILGIARTNDRFGSALAAGDFNGDGFSDLAIGVRGERVAGAANAGAVNVIYGSAAGLASAGNQLLTQATLSLANANVPATGGPPVPEYPEAGDQLGYALASGNADGDAFADLAIGAPGENGGNGYFVIVHGSASGLGETAGTAEAVPYDYFKNPTPRAGSALAMGNIDGSATDELVVGMPAGNVVYVYRTPLSAVSVFTTIAGFGSGDGKLGYSVVVGDFNGDGNDDVAMGAPAHDPGGAVNSGGLRVCYGPSITSGADCPDVTLPLLVKGARFGASLAAGGIDNDGYDDLAVGAPDLSFRGKMRAGAVFVIHGGAGGISGAFAKWHQGLRAVADAAEPLDRFGASLAIRDFNGDGYGELAVGVPGEAVDTRLSRPPRIGMVQVFAGSAAGIAGPGSRWHQNRAGILGAGRGDDAFGASLAQ